MSSMIPTLTQDLAQYLRGEWDNLDDSPHKTKSTSASLTSKIGIDMSDHLGDVTYLSMAANR